ncbi:MAG: rhomboid family intramembrane serine protease [Bacteroidaceae bacterium]|nr:rhomboid family intramembrane serine protease [Bacteroidaceae bacterium]
MNLNMPPVTKNLLIINLLMYLAKVVAVRYGIDFDDLLGLHFFLASDFKLYQLFTYMFVHGSFTHIFFNMFAVWMFGRVMEQVMGSQRFLFYYVVCGLGAGLVQEGAQYIEYVYQGLSAYDTVNIGGGMMVPMESFLNRWTTVGASGAVYGILLSFGMTFPEERMFIIPIPFPIKAKWFVIGYAVIELMSALGNTGDGVAHMAHLGGMLFGLLLILYWRKHPGGGRGRFFGGGAGGYGGFGGSDNYFTRYEDVTNTSSKRNGLWKTISQWFTDLKGSIAKHFRKQPKMHVHVSGKYSADMEWNRKKKEREQEMDRILDKVKRGGYESLTTEEKRFLFEASNN